MKNLLLSTTNFVEEIQNYVRESGNFARGLKLIFGYTEFKKTQIEIWQFVPFKLLEDVWVVLEEPFYYKDFVFNLFDKISEFDKIKCQEYQEAKECCLFDGFTYHIGLDKNNPSFWFVRNSFCKIHDYEFEVSSITIDDLSNRVQPIELSETAFNIEDYA
jgi:hypothetical protein